MQLSIERAEQIRELLISGQEHVLETIVWDSETLAGAMNLACIEKEVRSTLATKHLFFRLLDEWEHLPMFQAARHAMNHRGLWPIPSLMKAEPQPWEILPTPLQEQVDGLVWSDFQRRFEASLRACQFAGKLPKGIVGAFHEMADNSLRHSGPTIQRPAWGATGYFVMQGQMTFCIVDAGRGVLASLKTNSLNSALRTDKEALQAAVIGRVTSDARKEQGDGFEEVHRALSDENGRLRFRSGTSALGLDGRGRDRAVVYTDGMKSSAGLHVVVHCVLDGFDSDSEL
jgi:hypothetical protein